MTAKKGSVSLETNRCTYRLALASLMDALDEHLNASCTSQADYDKAWEEIDGAGLEAWLVANGFTLHAEQLV